MNDSARTSSYQLWLLTLIGLLGLTPEPAQADAEYSISDGAAELALSIDPSESLVLFNTFAVDPAGVYIDQVRIAYGRVGGPTPLNGQAVRILLYEDLDGGSPQNATLLWSFDTTVANGNTNTLNLYAVPLIRVRHTLVAGFYYRNINPLPVFIGALDTTPPHFAGRSYFGFAASIDPANLGAIPPSQFMTQEASGNSGNYRIEARGRLTADGITLQVAKLPALGVVRLSWTGARPSYQVERASRADFSDALVLASGLTGSSYDDPVLPDGRSWFYRVR